jgi:hypothetical protein
MRKKYMLIGVGIVVGVLLSSVVFVLAGSVDSPGLPSATLSYTLQDIYNRLNAGTAGTPSTLTEPAAGPGTGTMYTLNDIMGKAPAVDDANGAGVADVASGKTFWGLTSGAWGTQTGTGTIATYAAAVPKTGDAYNDGCCTGEDGELQKGVAWPNPRFTDNSNGTVTDNLTGLIWLKNANCTVFFSGDGTGQNNRSWANALTAANSLANGYCGLTDSSTAGQWRLPNVREMQSLVHYGVYNPAVPNRAGTGKWTSGDPFTGVQSSFYWSSTTYAGSTTYAWGVGLDDGLVGGGSKTITLYVWPVRGGQ